MTFHKTKKLKYFQEAICDHKRPLIAKAIVRIKNKADGITINKLRLYYPDIVIKARWHGGNSQIGHWNRIKNEKTYLKAIYP